jgi:hypothetical protein
LAIIKLWVKQEKHDKTIKKLENGNKTQSGESKP